MSPVHSAHVPEHIFKSASVHARSRSSREYSVASEHDLPRASAGSHSSVYNLLESYVQAPGHLERNSICGLWWTLEASILCSRIPPPQPVQPVCVQVHIFTWIVMKGDILHRVTRTMRVLSRIGNQIWGPSSQQFLK